MLQNTFPIQKGFVLTLPISGIHVAIFNKNNVYLLLLTLSKMKRFIYLILVFCIPFITSCGDGSSSKDSTTNENKISLKDYEELDLTPWGFEMMLMVPNANDNGEPEVTLTDRGALEIKVGKGFGVEIMFGEGSLEMLKLDLKESLVYTSEILKEEEDLLIYQQDIPNSGIKTKIHFFYKKHLGSDIYEIRDLVDGTYSLNSIEEILAAVKEIKTKAITTPIDDGGVS